MLEEPPVEAEEAGGWAGLRLLAVVDEPVRALLDGPPPRAEDIRVPPPLTPEETAGGARAAEEEEPP